MLQLIRNAIIAYLEEAGKQPHVVTSNTIYWRVYANGKLMANPTLYIKHDQRDMPYVKLWHGLAASVPLMVDDPKLLLAIDAWPFGRGWVQRESSTHYFLQAAEREWSYEP